METDYPQFLVSDNGDEETIFGADDLTSHVSDSSYNAKSYWYENLRGCVVVCITLGIISSNVINLRVWMRVAQIPLATRYFLLNLSFSDLLVGLISTSSAIYPAFTKHWPFGVAWCQISGVVHGMSLSISVWSIAMIGVDRYLATGYPLAYKRLMRRSRSLCIVGLMWLAAAATFITPILTADNFIYYRYNDSEAMCLMVFEPFSFFIAVFIYIPFLSATVLIFTGYKINKALNKLGQGPAINSNSVAQERQAMNRRAVRVIRVTSFCYFLLIGPLSTITLVGKLFRSTGLPEWIEFAGVWTANANCMMNVFIYSFTNKAFQNEAKQMFGMEKRRRQVATTAPLANQNVAGRRVTAM